MTTVQFVKVKNLIFVHTDTTAFDFCFTGQFFQTVTDMALVLVTGWLLLLLNELIFNVAV